MILFNLISHSAFSDKDCRFLYNIWINKSDLQLSAPYSRFGPNGLRQQPLPGSVFILLPALPCGTPEYFNDILLVVLTTVGDEYSTQTASAPASQPVGARLLRYGSAPAGPRNSDECSAAAGSAASGSGVRYVK